MLKIKYQLGGNMKKSLLIAMLTLTSLNSFSSTLVKCIVTNPRNVLILDIDSTHLKGTLTELNGQAVAIESTDGNTFTGTDFSGEITLAPGVYTSPATKTHALLVDAAGNKQYLNCMKRNLVDTILDTPTDVPTPTTPDYSECRVQITHTGNPHRDYDNKFRACRAKAVELGFKAEEQRTCQAICMKN